MANENAVQDLEVISAMTKMITSHIEMMYEDDQALITAMIELSSKVRQTINKNDRRVADRE